MSRQLLWSLLSVLSFASFAQVPAGDRQAAIQSAPPKIQIAILLDTSGSMDGLIAQTREQLWRMVTAFSSATRDGQRPELQLALYHYGNEGISAKAHYVQQLLPLTTDLDAISEALFRLKTNGGEEYCGAAIAHAVAELKWSDNPRDLKLIYIAGNEPFNQGPVAFKGAMHTAISRGIVVNTIYAGTQSEGVREGWASASKLADGQYLAIDSNRAIARVDAPQDAELARLSAELNSTYVAYGPKGKTGVARQAEQDSSAKSVSGSTVAQRASAKSSGFYRNAEWDLVDLKKEGKSVADLKPADLPAEMVNMSAPEKEAYVAQKQQAREALSKKIAALSAAREQHVAAEMKKRAAVAGKSMDDALIESAKAQATKAAFQF
jgi:von Willebrand factor type A domain